MKLCDNPYCLQELFDSDTKCSRCGNESLIPDSEIKKCRKELLCVLEQNKAELYNKYPYDIIIKYFINKQEYLFEEMNPEYAETQQRVRSMHIIKSNIQKNSNETKNTFTSNNKDISNIDSSKIICPNCGSTNIAKISTTNRLFSTVLLGLASSKIGKTYECKHCKYKW